jgi:hypothetical protein
MPAKAEHVDENAILVVAGIDDPLNISGSEHAAQQVRGVGLRGFRG